MRNTEIGKYFTGAIFVTFIGFLVGYALTLFGYGFLDGFLFFLIVIATGFIITLIYLNFYKKQVFGYASLNKRFWSLFTEMLGLHMILHGSFMLYLFLSGNYLERFTYYYGEMFGTKERFFLMELGLWTVYILYSIILELINRKGTLSKNSMKLRVTNLKGEPPTVGQILLRNFIRYLILLPGLAVLVMAFSEFGYYELALFVVLVMFTIALYNYPKLNKRRLYLHDVISKTRVLDISRGNMLKKEAPEERFANLENS